MCAKYNIYYNYKFINTNITVQNFFKEYMKRLNRKF